MNKIGLPTYLSNDKEFLIVKSTDIEVSHVRHGPPLKSNSLLEQPQSSIKAVKFLCGMTF